MKIIRKPKIRPCECEVCGCVFQPKKKDLGRLRHIYAKDAVECPFCANLIEVEFEVNYEKC